MSDILGVLIAFVSVMLLLSMLVTGLVQGTQAMLRLRGRNLLVGVASVVAALRVAGHEVRVSGTGTSTSDGKGSASEGEQDGSLAKVSNYLREKVRDDDRQKAADLLNNSTIATVDTVPEANRWGRILMGPKVSWANLTDLEVNLRRAAGLSPPPPSDREDEMQPEIMKGADESRANKQFKGESTRSEQSTTNKDDLDQTSEDREIYDESAASKEGAADKPKDELSTMIENLNPAMRRRFFFFIRMWTIFWSFVVAAAFQVSAPDLFSSFARGDISTEPFVEQVDEVLSLADTLVGVTRYQLIADEALDQLSEEFPEHSNLIAEVGSVEGDKETLLLEMRAVFSGEPERDKVVAAYDRLLNQLGNFEEDLNEVDDLGDVVRQLEAFDIRLWDKELDFYYDQKAERIHWHAVIGVLLTGILLSFGAPFWFEQLRNLASLRDLRAPRKTEPTQEKPVEIRLSGATVADSRPQQHD